MELLGDVLAYIQDNQARFNRAFETHLRLTAFALGWSLLIYFPLGLITARAGRIGAGVIGVVTALRVVPSLAIIFLGFSVFGIGFTTALIALVALAGPPIVINTDAGLRNVSPAILENARGLGMNPFQIFFRVELPLALPVIVAGIRSSAVEIIASAAIAAFIGVQSLGQFITSGLTLNDDVLLLVGAIPIAILALLVEGVLSMVERVLTPPTA